MYRQPNHEDIVNIVLRMYEKDGISKEEVVSVVNTFPNQGIHYLWEYLSYLFSFYIKEIVPIVEPK